VTRRVRISELASEEFADAVRWYEMRRAGLGREFFDAVAATIALIEQQPEIGTRNLDAPNTRRVIVHRFPYQVVYHLVQAEIVIVAIAHLKRRPGYWKHRS